MSAAGKSEDDQPREEGGVHQPEPSPRFVIAALGASAGGLHALEEFFAHVPPDPGIAFIVVQHLSPDHESVLDELLARCTVMPVEPVRDKTQVIPGRVYVIPPNTTLTIKECVLHLSKPLEARGRRTPIDALFSSLAEDRAEDAVCIMLSGTGTDGTLGLRAVKEHGGMAMAQTLESARYDAMLRSAIATGLVDHVLPPSDMPGKLMEYAAHLHSRDGLSHNLRKQIPEYSVRIHTILRRRVGHDFSLYKEGTVTRRLERRMKALQIENVEQYVKILEAQPEEADLLFKDLLIGVTEFFRDPEAFEALARDVVPKLFGGKDAGHQVRACVVGCATGEEAYSIAILLFEYAATLALPPEIKIFATDIDERGLEVARKGLYPASIAENISPERLDRFFTKQDGGYQVKRELRETCLFSTHSFIKDPPFSRLDLISCRNVMIYLGDALQRRVVPLFHYALLPGGYLFLGASENVNSHKELFRPFDKKHRIFQKKEAPPRTVAFPLGGVSPAKLPGRKRPPVDGQGLAKRLERIILHRYAPACVIVNEEGDAVYFSGSIGRFIEQPTGSPDNNLLNMAREGLRIPLRAALHRAATALEAAIQTEVPVRTANGMNRVDFRIEPLTEIKDASLFMVVISESPARDGKQVGEPPGFNANSEEILRHLEGQLRSAQEQAQAMYEELESANEELNSANEEFQSTNEELETSKEELQSFNEELETVNSELNRRVLELDTANSDLQNLLNGTQIATVFLDPQLRVRNFTPAAGTMFHLLTHDIGRPISDLAAQFSNVDLATDAKEVLTSLSLRERQVTATDGRAYQQRIYPYRTVNNVIAGVVFTFVDVTELRRAEASAQEARAYAESIVNTVREPLVVLDAGTRVVSASKSFYERFRQSAAETVGKSFHELGDREWDTPPLRALLADALPRSLRINNFAVDRDFRHLGHRIMLLNGRPLEQGDGKNPLYLLAIEDATERKLAARALAENDRRRREMIEALPTPVYTVDAEGRLTLFNRACVEFAGRVPQIGVDRWCVTAKLFSADGSVMAPGQSAIETALREDRSIHGVEAIAERPDGTRRNFLAYPTPLHDETGKLIGAMNMLVDITGRKSIEEQLRQSETRLSSLFEQSSGGIAQTELDGRFVLVNEEFCRIAGRSRTELLTLYMQDIAHPGDQPAYTEKFAALAAGRSSNFTVETRFTRPDGSFVWVESQVSAIHDERGEIRSLATVVTDIGERKKAEEARGLLVALVETSDDAIFSADVDGTIRTWNAGAELLFGYSAEEAVGQPLAMLIEPGYEREAADNFQRVQRGERIPHHDTVRRRKDGSRVDISLAVSPIVNERGHVIGSSRIAWDIADRKRLEQERRDLAERERAIAVKSVVQEMEAELARVSRALTVGELATSIAHEVNQPLAGIVTNAEACLRWIAGANPNLAEAHQSLALIVRDGNRASEVIQRIRDFLKKDSVQVTRLDMNRVIHEALALANADLVISKVAVRLELALDLPLVWADRIQMQQVILNLIINAREAMAASDGTRELTLRSQPWESDGVLVTVQDSGDGVTAGKVDRMFEAFFTTKPTGMGMGLSISRSIVEAHGGRIWATPNPASGMTIQFTLPHGSESP